MSNYNTNEFGTKRRTNQAILVLQSNPIELPAKGRAKKATTKLVIYHNQEAYPIVLADLVSLVEGKTVTITSMNVLDNDRSYSAKAFRPLPRKTSNNNRIPRVEEVYASRVEAAIKPVVRGESHLGVGDTANALTTEQQHALVAAYQSSPNAGIQWVESNFPEFAADIRAMASVGLTPGALVSGQIKANLHGNQLVCDHLFIGGDVLFFLAANGGEWKFIRDTGFCPVEGAQLPEPNGAEYTDFTFGVNHPIELRQVKPTQNGAARYEVDVRYLALHTAFPRAGVACGVPQGNNVRWVAFLTYAAMVERLWGVQVSYEYPAVVQAKKTNVSRGSGTHQAIRI